MPLWSMNGFLTLNAGRFNTVLSVRRVSRGILNVEQVAPGGGGLGESDYPTNPVYFDTSGARWRAGARVRY